MKKPRITPDGDPIIDEPLLSPKRIIGAIWLWAYFDAEGTFEGRDRDSDEMLWPMILYHRRPWASFKKQFY